MGTTSYHPSSDESPIPKLLIRDARPSYGSGGLLTERVTGVSQHDHRALIRKIEKGLDVSAFKVISESLQLAQSELADVLSIPTSTLARRKKEKELHFNPLESDRIVRLTRLWDSAVKLMEGDKNKARAWLQTPLDIFGDKSPMAYAKTSIGAEDVEDLIGRMRHGVFS